MIVKTVKELREALSEFPDDFPLVGLAGNKSGKGTSEFGRVEVYQYPGDTKSVCVVVQPPPYLGITKKITN